MSASEDRSETPSFVLLGDKAAEIVANRMIASGEMFARLWSRINQPRLGTWLYSEEISNFDYGRASRAGSNHMDFAAVKLTGEMQGLYLLHRHPGEKLHASPLFEGQVQFCGIERYSWRKVGGDQAFERVREFIEWPSVVCVGVCFGHCFHLAPGTITNLECVDELELRFVSCPAFDDEGGIFWFWDRQSRTTSESVEGVV